jgi:hypothetical protein
MMVTLDGQLTPGSYEPLRFTFLIWVMVIVGGSGNNWGAVLGGFVIWFLWVRPSRRALADEKVAFLVGRPLGDDNPRTLETTFIRRPRHRFDAGIVVERPFRDQEVEGAQRRPHITRFERIFDHPMLALERDRGDAVMDGQAFRVGIMFFADGLAIVADDPLHGKARHADRNAIGVTLHRAKEPVAVIGDPDEFVAGCQEPQRGKLAEAAQRRLHLEPADEFEWAETRLVGADAEAVDGQECQLDIEGRLGHSRCRRKRQRRQTCGGEPARGCRPGHQPARRIAGRRLSRRVSRAVCSPNSAASCSVMAPASSSASTMVTARR